MTIERAVKGARDFGFTFAGLSALLSVLQWWRGRPAVGAALAVVAVALTAAAIIKPVLLNVPNRLWMRLARVLGWINSRVLLTLFFFFIITPYGLLLRACGRDTIGARWRATPPRWWPAPERLGNHDHYDHLY